MVCALSVLALPTGSIAVSSSLRPADYVGWARVEMTGSTGFELSCATPPGGYMTHEVVATAIGDGELSNLVRVRASSFSSSGHWLQVGDEEVVWEERIEHNTYRSTGWTLWGNFPPASEGDIGRIAWAVWGASPACTLKLNGAPVPVQIGNGAFAFYAPPGAFSGGLYYQDGPLEVAVARTFQSTALGGPVFVKMEIGFPSAGTLLTSTPGGAPTLRNCNLNQSQCEQFVPAATEITAVLHAGRTVGVSQLFMIALPPEVSARDQRAARARVASVALR